MPQMMPINWLISFFFFICIFIMFIIMNYYIVNMNINNSNNSFNKIKMKNLHWKW